MKLLFAVWELELFSFPKPTPFFFSSPLKCVK